MTNSTRRPIRRSKKPAADLGSLMTFRPFFAGKGWTLTLLSAGSFLAGIAEAGMLVIVAKLALSIGGTSSLSGGLGPIESIKLTTGQMFLLALGSVVARLVLQLVTAHLTARLAADLTASIREGTFSDYVRASWAIQAAEQESDVQDLLVRHVNRATGAVTMLAAGLAALFSLLALVGSALVVDPLAAALVIVAGALLFPILRPMTTKAKRAASDQVEAGRNYGVRSLEAVDLSVEIRSFGVSDEVASRLVIATAAEVRPVYLSVLLNRVVNAAYQVAALLILLAGLFAVDKLVTRPLASLGAIVIILVRSLNQSAALQSTYHSMSETLPFAQRLLAERERFRNSIPPQGSTKIAGADRLRFEHVSYHYVEGRPALTDVSFEVEAGQAVGIIGPSGSGKSTLIQLLLRLRHADEGCYTIGGVNATEFDNDSWFSNVAFVPQDCRVFNDTIEENIRFFRMDATHDDIVDAARRAHIHGEIVGMPDGYQTVLGSRGGALSGGQRQRIAIARALVRRPTILVLDEPTSALDMRSESLVHETFTQLKGSVTLFVIAHRLSTLNTCDRIMVLGDGRLQAFGLREELERESGFYRDALELSRIRS